LSELLLAYARKLVIWDLTALPFLGASITFSVRRLHGHVTNMAGVVATVNAFLWVLPPYVGSIGWRQVQQGGGDGDKKGPQSANP